MFRILNVLLFVLWAAVLFAQGEVREFRLDQDRLWLTVENEPLSSLLENFAKAGVRVDMDPAVGGTVSGTWSNRDVERALKAILSPNNYFLDWQREPGPLGPLTRLTGIRLFREGHAGDARPLRNTRRIQTSLDGTRRFMAREILIGFGPGASIDDLRALLARLGGTVIAANSDLGIYRILLPEGANVLALLKELERDPTLTLAEPNYIVDLPELLPGKAPASGGSTHWTPPSGGDGTIAVSVLDGPDGLEVLPAVEIVVKSGLFDFNAMYTHGETDYFVPARLDPEQAAEAAALAREAHLLLGCRDVSRADMVCDAEGEIWLLECNTSPGMTDTSLLPMAAETAGLSFQDVVERLVHSALSRRS